MPIEGGPKQKQTRWEKLEPEEKEDLSIFNKHREYFETFLSKTDQKENTNKFLIENSPVKEKQKILSIGAGSGEDVFGFLKHLKSKGTSFEFYYLDPSELSFKKFEEKAGESNLTEHISSVINNKFETFETKEKFDTIIASHVFYYIEKWKESLSKIAGMLNKDSKAFIIMQSKNSDNFKFRNIFLEKEHYGEELIDVIKELNLDYDTEKIISTLDVTDTTLENNKLFSSGKQLLSFLLRTNYNNLNNKIKSEINKYILENSKKIENERSVFQLVDNYITIKKTTK